VSQIGLNLLRSQFVFKRDDVQIGSKHVVISQQQNLLVL